MCAVYDVTAESVNRSSGAVCAVFPSPTMSDPEWQTHYVVVDMAVTDGHAIEVCPSEWSFAAPTFDPRLARANVEVGCISRQQIEGAAAEIPWLPAEGRHRKRPVT